MFDNILEWLYYILKYFNFNNFLIPSEHGWLIDIKKKNNIAIS